MNPSFQYDAKNWTFLVFQHDSKNWIFFDWLKKMNLVSKEVSKSGTFFDCEVGVVSFPFLLDSESSIFSICFNELNFFLEYDPQNWTPFINTTHRIEPFFDMTHRIEHILFLFSTMTQRIELFVNDSFNWASFMNLFSTRVELLFLSDSKNWTFFECNSKSWIFWAWLKE